MDWHDWVGHFSYVLLATSYLVTQMAWLRTIAVLALALEVVYLYAGSDKPLWVGIGWALVFVAINLFQLLRMYLESRGVRLSPDARRLHQGVFSHLAEVELQRLVNIGRWMEVPKGMQLTQIGDPVPELMVLMDGVANVLVGERVVATLRSGALIGEISFVTKRPATATVVAQADSRVFAFGAAKLEQMIKKFPEMEVKIQQVMALDLTGKLASSAALTA
jgi:hypothetical protein